MVYDIQHAHNMETSLQLLKDKGYLIIPKLLPEAYIDYVKSRLQLPNHLEGGKIQKRCGKLLEIDHVFADILAHPYVLEIVRNYLHPNAKCGTWSSNTLYPVVDTTSSYHWHVDYPYHDIRPPWLDHPLSAQVLWCLDDFTYDNGGTLIIPGSHTFGGFPNSKVIETLPKEVIQAPKGSVIISHGAWWHSQGINRTSATRTCLLGTFIQPWIQAKDDMAKQYKKIKDKENYPNKDILKSILGI